MELEKTKPHSRFFGAVSFLRKDNISHILRLFMVFIACLIFLGVLNKVFHINIKFNGFDFIVVFAVFVFALVSFKDDFRFLMQNTVPKKDIILAFLTNSLYFILLNLLLLIVMAFVSRVFLQFFPKTSLEWALIDITRDALQQPKDLVQAILSYFVLLLMVYGFGLMLATINYRLNKVGQIVFWILFALVVISLAILINISVEYLESNGQHLSAFMFFNLEQTKQLIEFFIKFTLDFKYFPIVQTIFFYLAHSLLLIRAEVKYSK